MTYLLICSLLFSILALRRSVRFEWSVLSVMTLVNFILTCVFDVENKMLYVLVPIVTSAGATALCMSRSTLGFYQAVVLLATLIAYCALNFDVALGRHFLIYNNYEVVIYGLVGCQLLAAIPTVRAAYRDLTSGRINWLFNLQRGQRS